jgi:galactokinase
MAMASDLPTGAGLSSSAALGVAVARALAAASGLEWSPRDAAAAAQRGEHVFAGVQCGIMDPLASAAARDGSGLLIDCRSLETRDVPIPDTARIVVVDTGMARTLAASKYNERRAECAAAVSALQALDPAVRSLRDVDDALLAKGKAVMHPVTFRRALHVIAENYRPSAFADALGRGDLGLAGLLMRQSHASLRDLYEVSSDELDTVVDLASSHPAVFGARMTGAGFGGCAIALTSPDVGDLPERIMDGYRERTGREAHVFVTRPSAGARLME